MTVVVWLVVITCTAACNLQKPVVGHKPYYNEGDCTLAAEFTRDLLAMDDVFKVYCQRVEVK